MRSAEDFCFVIRFVFFKTLRDSVSADRTIQYLPVNRCSCESDIHMGRFFTVSCEPWQALGVVTKQEDGLSSLPPVVIGGRDVRR